MTGTTGGSAAAHEVTVGPRGRGHVGGLSRAQLGVLGERLAREHLVVRGWQVLEVNWRSPSRECPGELDVVAVDPGGQVVVVEVRTRRGSACGSALESVTPEKLRRLRRLFGVWWAGRSPSERVRLAGGARIDVLAVQVALHGEPHLEHVVGVG